MCGSGSCSLQTGSMWMMQVLMRCVVGMWRHSDVQRVGREPLTCRQDGWGWSPVKSQVQVFMSPASCHYCCTPSSLSFSLTDSRPHSCSALFFSLFQATLAAANVAGVLQGYPAYNQHNITPFLEAPIPSMPQAAPSIVNAADINMKTVN